MKKLILAGILIASMANSFGSCIEEYSVTAESYRPKALAKEIGLSDEGFVVANAAALGVAGLAAGPIAVAGGAAGMIAFYDKADRLQFFSDLISGAKRYKRASIFRNVDPFNYIPQTQIGMSALVGSKTIFSRVEKQVLKHEPEATLEDILKAIVRADEKEDFCQSIRGEKPLKTSVKEFARVVLENL